MRKTLKHGVSLLLALFMLAGAAPMRFPAFAADQLITGDVNLDGKLGADDARLALRETVGLEVLHDDSLRCADADHDNDVTAADARLILRASVGLETLKPMPETLPAVVFQGKGFPAKKLTFPGGKPETLGTIGVSGVTMEVEPGSLKKGAVVSATPLTKEQFEKIPTWGKFERILFPMEITCEGYDGAFFDGGVKMTVPLLEKQYDENTPYDRFVFCYYDEATKEILYQFPDEIDREAHTMTVSLPHFSPWWGAKLTEQQQIELFLDRYCTQLAVQQSDRKKAAAEMEPYLNAKAEALQLTANAAKDLIEGAVNYMGGTFVCDTPGSDKVGDLISIGTNYTTGMIRAYYDKDKEKARDSLKGAADSAIQQIWKELEFSKRAGEVFKKEYVKEFVPGAVDKLISKFGTLGTLFGCLSADDPEGAMIALADVLSDASPEAALATKAIGFVVTALHTSFTFWKSNQIEALYRVYKNGYDGWFGNEVVARDRKSFLTFLNCSSGFTMAKGVNRFYKMDKIGEICNKYGWSFKTYASMPQKYRDIFEKRAENGLMTYFETRLAQEDAAEKLKEEMRDVVNTMLNEDLGALKRTNFHGFFHDDYSTYDVGNRLERLTRVKAFVAQYVDEAKLKADKTENWGDMLNSWIFYADRYPKDQALEKFIAELKQKKLLRDGMDVAYKRSAVKQFFGTWVGYFTWDVFREYEQVEGTKWTVVPVYDKVVRKYTYTIGLDLQGRLTIQRQEEDVKKNGEPYSNPSSSVNVTSRLDDKAYQVRNGTLIVPSKNNIGGYSYKFQGGLNSYETHTQWDYDKEDFVDYEICISCSKVSDIGGKPTQ